MDETNTKLVGRPEPTMLTQRDIGIEGMTCDRCVETVERALKTAKGVKDVRVDRETARATVTFDPRQTHIPELHDVLLKSGYTPKPTAD